MKSRSMNETAKLSQDTINTKNQIFDLAPWLTNGENRLIIPLKEDVEPNFCCQLQIKNFTGKNIYKKDD